MAIIGRSRHSTEGAVSAPSGLPYDQVPLVSLADTDGSAIGGGGGSIARILGQISGAAADTSFARPADTTAYAALDAVSNSTSAPGVITFANAARAAGRGGYIVGARLMTDQSTNVARFRLHLFHTSPSAVNDNSPQTVLWANRASRIGSLTFAAAATEGTGSTAATAQAMTDRIPFDLPAAGTSVFGMLETLDAFTPASGQSFYLELLIDQS